MTSYYDLPDLISISTHTDPHIQMQKYDSNCRSRTTWFDLAGTFCSLSEPEPLNAFESIEGLSNTEVDNLDSPAYSEEQSHILSPWNIYWTEAAAYGGGLELDNPVFGSN